MKFNDGVNFKDIRAKQQPIAKQSFWKRLLSAFDCKWLIMRVHDDGLERDERYYCEADGFDAWVYDKRLATSYWKWVVEFNCWILRFIQPKYQFKPVQIEK